MAMKYRLGGLATNTSDGIAFAEGSTDPKLLAAVATALNVATPVVGGPQRWKFLAFLTRGKKEKKKQSAPPPPQGKMIVHYPVRRLLDKFVGSHGGNVGALREIEGPMT